LATLAIAIVFLLMLAAPCVVALRSARKGDEPVLEDTHEDEVELEDAEEPVIVEAYLDSVEEPNFERILTLQELAIEAEIEAIRAKDLALEMHWASLAAAAKAARLRADSAVQLAEDAARTAEEAYRAADQNLVRARGRRAA
jgi:hypothetical protein